MDNRPNWPPGTLVGPYRIVRLLGEGGMGQVYEAREDRLDRRLALKVLTQLEAKSYGNFLEEARTLSTLSHPNIVSLYAVDIVNNIPLIAMEYVAGLTMRDLCDRFVLSAFEAAPLFLQVLEALDVIHKNHVLHRDLSARNLVLRADGQMKILDFGISKNLTVAGTNTTSGMIAGTLQYMAPEVLSGQPATARSDMWSVGAVFFECMNGDRIKNNRVAFNREALSWIPHEAQKIINRLCALDPAERYPSAEHAANDLRKFIGMSAKKIELLQPLDYHIKNLTELRALKIAETAAPVRVKRATLQTLREWQRRQRNAGDMTPNIDTAAGIELPADFFQGQLSIMAVQALAPQITPARVQPAPRKVDIMPYALTVTVIAGAAYLYSVKNTAPAFVTAPAPVAMPAPVPVTEPVPVPAKPVPPPASPPSEVPGEALTPEQKTKLQGLEAEMQRLIEADEVGAKLEEANERLKAIEEENREAQKELEPLDEEIREVEAEGEKVSKKIDELREQMESSREKHEPREVREKIAEEMKTLAQERISARQELGKLNMHREREAARLETQAKQRLQQANAQVDQLTDRLRELAGQTRRPASDVQREIDLLLKKIKKN